MRSFPINPHKQWLKRKNPNDARDRKKQNLNELICGNKISNNDDCNEIYKHGG